MGLATLLPAELSPAGFVRDYYLQLPWSGPGAAHSWLRWTEDRFADLAATPGVDGLAARGGAPLAAGFPLTLAQQRQVLANGGTLAIRHAERHDPVLDKFAAALERELGGRVNVHAYATSPGQFGFGAHYDAEDVFFVQTVGEKEYSFRKNTVHPWPLEETLPEDMQFASESQPLMRCRLRPGDVLYLPAGYWHRADAAAGAVSISLAIGVMQPAAIDLLAAIRPLLVQSLAWRQRLPVAADAGPWSDDDVRRHLQGLAPLLSREIADALVSDAGQELVLHWLRSPPAVRSGPNSQT